MSPWFSSKQEPQGGEIHEFQNMIQSLQMELAERDKIIAALQADLTRLQLQQNELQNAAVSQALEQYIQDIAPTAVQIYTQVYLLESQTRPVAAESVALAAVRLLRGLEPLGFQVIGEIGASVRFDPNLHMALSPDSEPGSGEAAVIRLVGIAFRGQVLRKAGVERRKD